MGVQIRCAGSPTGRALAFARRFGLLAGMGVTHKVFEGWVYKIVRDERSTVVVMIEPPGLWAFASFLDALYFNLAETVTKPIYTGKTPVYGAAYANAIYIPSTISTGLDTTKTQTAEQLEASIIDPDKYLRPVQPALHYLGNIGDANISGENIPTTSNFNAGRVTLATAGNFGLDNVVPAASGFKDDGVILLKIITSEDVFQHLSERKVATNPDKYESERSSGRRRQSILRRLFVPGNALVAAGVPNPNIASVGELLTLNRPQPMRYAFGACIRKIPEEDEEDQKPWYDDAVVVIPYVDCEKDVGAISALWDLDTDLEPKQTDFTHLRAGVQFLREEHGFTVMRLRMTRVEDTTTIHPGDRRELGVLWASNKKFTAMPGRIAPTEVRAWLRPPYDMFTPPVVIPGMVNPVTGFEAHSFVCMGSAVREPDIAPPLRVAPTAVPNPVTPAQLTMVVTTYTMFYTDNQKDRFYEEIPPEEAPEEPPPAPPEPQPKFCLSTQVYTYDLASGNSSRTALVPDVERYLTGALAPIPAPDPETTFDLEAFLAGSNQEFPVFWTYAGAGQAVPCVSVTVDSYVDKDDVRLSNTDFKGYEIEGTTEFHMVYPGGYKIKYALDNWCPVRPFMRGGASSAMGFYPYITPFGRTIYNTNVTDGITSLIWDIPNKDAGGWDGGYDDTSDSPLRIDEDDETENVWKTRKREYNLQNCGSQFIAAQLGNGKVALLVCPMAQQWGAVKLDWYVAICAENSGQLLSEPTLVFEQLPLESCQWVSIVVQRPERTELNIEFGKGDGVITCHLTTPRRAILQPEWVYNTTRPPIRKRVGYNPFMHLAQHRSENAWAGGRLNDATKEQFNIDYKSETRISTDSGATWAVMLTDVAGDAFYLGNSLKMNDNK